MRLGSVGNYLRTIIVLASYALLVGCATGYNRGEMASALKSAKPNYVSSELSKPNYVSSELSVEEIERMKPQLKFPARIAVAPPVQTYTYHRWGTQGSLGNWNSEEIAVIESWQEPLRAAGVAEDIVVLPSSLVKDCEYGDAECRLKAQRAAAARVHADALLIVTLATATDEYVNPASFLYFSIIGMWFVPASHRDALTVAEGVLLDNRNEYLYVFARGEGEKQSVRPIMYADTPAAVKVSRIEALKSFGSAFLEQARRLSIK